MTTSAAILSAGAPRARPLAGQPLVRALGALVSLPMLCGYVYLGLGLFLMLGLGSYAGDALARTASALYVVLSRDPHLAAIGFVWNPLPSIVQIPLVLALDPFGLAHLAGPIQSAAFGAGSVFILDRILRLLGTGTWRRRALLLAYGLDPIIVFYGANGMSESPLIFFMLAATHQFVRWARGGPYSTLIFFALLSAGTFLVRYEGIAFAAAGILGLTAAFLFGKDLNPDRLEAILLTYTAPISYVVALWIFFNWILVGDPLHFYRSSYGNVALTAGFRSGGETYLSGAVGSIAGSAAYAAVQSAYVFPASVLIAALAAIRGLLRKEHVTLGVLGFALSLPAFHAYLVYSGTSFGWLRFFIYCVPFSFVLLPLVLEPLRGTRPAWIAGWAISFALILVSWPASLFALADPNHGREEAGIVAHLIDPTRNPLPASYTFGTDKEIARYVDGLPPGTVVLMDSALAFSIDLFARDHRRYAITNDRDFPQILDRPDGGAVTHILVTRRSDSEAVGAALPGLWQAGAAYATLERDFGGPDRWRLYRVHPAEEGR